MTDLPATRWRFGAGPLARASARIYTLLVVELSLVVATAPGLVLLALLDRDASNLPLVALCAVPVGPALSAAVYALCRQRPDLTDLRPARAFRRGYRLNVWAVLRVWVPLLVVLTVIAVNLTHRAAAGVPVWWSVLLAMVAAVLLLTAFNALVITSLFVFRTVDVARLAVFYLIRRPGVTLGNTGLLLAAGILALVSSTVLLVLASLFVGAVLVTSRPMVTEIEERYTA